MIRTAAWPVILILGTGHLCHGQDFPPPRPIRELPPAKAEGVEKPKKDAEKPKKDAEKSAAPAVPILFPSPPYRPADRPVLDPRTGAWEQVYGDFNVVADEGIPTTNPGPIGIAAPSRTRTRFGHWSRMFKARPACDQTIDLYKTGKGEWHVVGVPSEQ